MRVIKVGSVAIFKGYVHRFPEVPDVFKPGDRILIVMLDGEGAYLAVLLNGRRPQLGISGLVFDEEVSHTELLVRPA